MWSRSASNHSAAILFFFHFFFFFLFKKTIISSNPDLQQCSQVFPNTSHLEWNKKTSTLPKKK